MKTNYQKEVSEIENGVSWLHVHHCQYDSLKRQVKEELLFRSFGELIRTAERQYEQKKGKTERLLQELDESDQEESSGAQNSRFFVTGETSGSTASLPSSSPTGSHQRGGPGVHPVGASTASEQRCSDRLLRKKAQPRKGQGKVGSIRRS